MHLPSRTWSLIPNNNDVASFVCISLNRYRMQGVGKPLVSLSEQARFDGTGTRVGIDTSSRCPVSIRYSNRSQLSGPCLRSFKDRGSTKCMNENVHEMRPDACFAHNLLRRPCSIFRDSMIIIDHCFKRFHYFFLAGCDRKVFIFNSFETIYLEILS